MSHPITMSEDREAWIRRWHSTHEGYRGEGEHPAKVADLLAELDATRAALASAHEAVRLLAEALEKFGRHDHWCATEYLVPPSEVSAIIRGERPEWKPPACDCGFIATKADPRVTAITGGTPGETR